MVFNDAPQLVRVNNEDTTTDDCSTDEFDDHRSYSCVGPLDQKPRMSCEGMKRYTKDISFVTIARMRVWLVLNQHIYIVQLVVGSEQNA